MSALKFYYLNTEYLNFLSHHQRYIWNNDYDGSIRPYVGVVFEIGGYKYYAPLSSFKPNRYGRTLERIDLKIIKIRGREVAFLQLNNMVPVHDSLLTLVDIDSLEQSYQDLLHAELANIRPRASEIIRDAERVYNLTTQYRLDPANEGLVKRCYDFKLLESKLVEYLNK
jgi:protein AbiQ